MIEYFLQLYIFHMEALMDYVPSELPKQAHQYHKKRRVRQVLISFLASLLLLFGITPILAHTGVAHAAEHVNAGDVEEGDDSSAPEARWGS